MITQDEIIRMAREAGISMPSDCSELWCEWSKFERFAALVAAHEREKFQAYVDQVKADREFSVLAAVLAEREACAKVVETTHATGLQSIREACAAAIRARSEK